MRSCLAIMRVGAAVIVVVESHHSSQSILLKFDDRFSLLEKFRG